MKFLLALLALTCLQIPAAGADSINTIQLRNRPAAEVIPIVEPLLGPGDAISGHGFKIFLRASPQTVDEVRGVVDSLDIASKSLLISVFQGRRSDLEKLAFSGVIRIENGSLDAELAAQANRETSQSGPLHRLRVAEGTRAYIEAGAQLPFYSGNESRDYASATSGFYVLPRIHGDRVTLEISPFRNSASRTGSGSIETLQADTTISGRLGEWLPLGGVSERIERSRSDGVSQSSTRGKRQDTIWLRADLME